MRKVFKFNNKALSADGFHVPNGTLNDKAYGSKAFNTNGSNALWAQDDGRRVVQLTSYRHSEPAGRGIHKHEFN